MATAFWTLAARERAAGRKAEAAEVLARGAEAWGGSEIAPALRALADDLRADQPAAWPAAVPGRGQPRRAEMPESGSLAEQPADAAALALVTPGATSDAGRLAAIHGAPPMRAGAGAGSDAGGCGSFRSSSWLARAGQRRRARAAAFAAATKPTTPPGSRRAGWPPSNWRAGWPIPSARARALIALGSMRRPATPPAPSDWPRRTRAWATPQRRYRSCASSRSGPGRWWRTPRAR